MPSASEGSRHGPRRRARPSAGTGSTLFDELTPPDEAGAGASGAGPDAEPRSPAEAEAAADAGPAETVGPARGPEGRRVVRVLPDEPAIAKTFDYLVPDAFGDQVRVGARVRVALAGRRVGGWIVATDVEPPAGRALRPLAKMSGYGPPPELIDLARWAAWRWAGRSATFLRTASPDRVVTGLPTPPPRRGTRAVGERGERGDHGDVGDRRPGGAVPPRRGADAEEDGGGGGEGGRSGLPAQDGAPVHGLARAALAAGRAVLRLPPASDPSPVVEAAVARGNALVVCPNARMAEAVARRLRRGGVPVALHPRDWALGAAGATVVGTRAAAWAPVGDLAAVVVVDEHDEAHAQEQAPTWHARDVVVERARRAGVACVLVSPCPSLEALRWGRLLTLSRRDERDGWPVVDVVDRRDDDPRTGLFAPALVERLRGGGRVLCVLNRTGRARLLACTACGDLAHCERCEAAVTQPGEDELVCPRCGQVRPVVCTSCGSTRFKLLRQGVSRVREELEALVGEPVGEVTAGRSGGGRGRHPGQPGQPGHPGPGELRHRVVVGTEAILHQAAAGDGPGPAGRVDVVAFLDLDQELLAPRYRTAEQALALLARAARLLGGKPGGAPGPGGRLVLQTRLPRHEVVQAALHGDPERVGVAEAERRELLRFPPAAALAEVSGATAEAYVAALQAHLQGREGREDREAAADAGATGEPWAASTTASAGGLEVLGPADGRWLVRAADHRTLCDALAATPRPAGRLRIAVDPLRL